MAVNTLWLNRTFPIYNADGTSFNNLELRKAVVDSIVMSLGDKITGEVYYKDNSLAVTMHEYIDYNGVRYMLVNPPTVVREGMVSDNGQLNGMTKYSFEFYHPMYLLGNIPFNDVAVTADETRYLSENAVFSWIGYPDDLIAKLNKNLQGTEWIVVKSSRFPNEKDNELSEVIPFNNAMISDVLKTFYDTWGVPFVIGQVESTEAAYAQGKRFKVIFGLPYNEIYETPEDRSGDIPFVFQFGQGVGLKNNSRNPRNNKIVTRIAGYGAERNVPYGYPQIPWYGDSRWDWTEYEGDVINYDINDNVTNNPKSTAYPIYDGIVSGQPTRLIKHPFTRTHLMPSIYGELLFNKVSPYISGGGVNPSYNPNIQLKDFYDAIATQEYPYINEINPSAPSYQFKEFEKIYPELGEEYIYGVQPLNDDLTPAPDWDDSIDNDGNYNQSYFAITLPILSFDIYASAAITEEMEINMRSGACLGCTFQVQVDWEDYKNNFFNSDGEFDPIPHTAENDGHVRDAKKYPDSSQTRVTVIVKKDLETFGTLMPNIYQYPIAGDQFVVLGISMPQSYISNAEARLDAEMKTYMLENNVYYFDYPLKFDEKFLRDNTYILSQLRPNSIVRFNYAGQQLQLYVKQLTVKYGEKPLPQYDITLTDNVEVVLNQLGQVADDIERLSTLISIVRENYSRSVWAELAKKLSKVDDDTAQGTIRFLKGLQVGSRFVSGLLGSGGIFRRNADGKTYLETDNLYVRMKAYFDTVEVREYEHSHGGRIASSAGQKVSHVVKMGYYPEGSQTKVPLDDDNYYHYIDPATGDETLIPLDVCCYRCYYRAKENRDTTEQATRQNTFKRGDMARCHMVNNSLNQKDYWRIVDETNEYDTFYNGEYGWTDLTNEAHFDVTGTSTCWGYMGASSGEAADVPEMGDDLYQLGSVTDADRQGAIVEATTGNDTPAYRIYQSVGKDLRPTPAQGQPPLSEFDPFTLEDRDYIDLFYNSATGRAQMDVYGDAYIGSKDRSTTYIKYTQDDGTQQHRPKLEIKAILDLASPLGNTGNTLGGSLQTLANYISELQAEIDGVIDTWFYDYLPVDMEAATQDERRVPLLWTGTNHNIPCKPYYDWFVADGGDPADPTTTPPTTDSERRKHLNDIFYDNSTGYAFRFSRDSQTNEFIWVEITDSAVLRALADAAHAQDTADHKRRVFVLPETVGGVVKYYPYPPYDVGDMWVNARYPYDTGLTFNNDLLRCGTAKGENDSFNISDWDLASKYTDDTQLEEFLDGYQGTLTTITNQIDKKAETWRQPTDPALAWYDTTTTPPTDTRSHHIGDLWMDTSVNGGNKTYIYQNTGTEQNPVYEWMAQEVPSEVFDLIDGKGSIYTVWNDWLDLENGVNRLEIRDLYIPQVEHTEGTGASAIVFKINKVYRCLTVGSYTFTEGSGGYNYTQDTAPTFQEIAYTDDTAFNSYITNVLNGTTGTSASEQVAAAAHALNDALNAKVYADGGLLLTTLIALRKLKQNGLDPSVLSNYDTWSGISGSYRDAETGTGWKGHGIAAWYGGEYIDFELYPNYASMTETQKEALWSTDRFARSLFRFDGSGYLASGNITWDKEGRLTIRTIFTNDQGNPELSGDLLNDMLKFNSVFSFNLSGDNIVSVTPNKPFTLLNINRPSGATLTGNSVLSRDENDARYLKGDLFWTLFGVYSSDGTTDLTSTFISTGTLPTGAVIKAKTGLFTDSFLSALGLNPNSGGGGGTGDVTWDALASSQDSRPISWEHIETAVTQQGYITSALLAAYLTTNGYATQSWVGQQGFLTSQDITANLINNALGFTLSGTSGSTYNLDNFALASALSGYLPISGGTITGSLNIDGGLTVGDPVTIGDTLSVNDDIFMMNKLVATREWVGLNYTDTVTLNTMLGNYLLKSGGTMTGTLYMGAGTYFRLYEDANSYASIYASATDGLSIGFNNGATVAAINLDANTEIGGTLGVTGNVTVGHTNTNGGYIQIGGVRLVYDSTNNALYVISSDGSTAANFYTTGGNSALGYSPSGSGGGGTGDVTWTALAAQATNNRTIHSSYIADTLANYLLVSGGTVTGDLTLLGNVFATTSAFNINHLYLTTGFVVQMVDRLNNNQSAFAFDANNNFVFSLGTHNAKFIASDLLVGTNTVWHGGNFPLAISSPTSGQVLKFNGTSWVNDAAPTGGGTVTSITAGTGLSGGTITGSGTIAIDSTYQTYISNGNTAYGWGNHANAGYALASALASYLPLSAGTSYPITGALCLSALNEIRLYQDSTHYAKITPDASDGLTIAFSAGNTMNQLNLPTNTYIGSDIVASQTWVGQQGFALASAIPTNNNQLTNGAGYITASALNGYATQTWVGQQGYITSSSISDMATMTWVVNQDYVSTSDLNTTLSGYATTSALSGYLPLGGGTMTGNISFTNGNAVLTWGALTNSPITSYALPALGSHGVALFSRYGSGSDEGGLIISEDTAVIYNSFDTGWGFQVHDKDLGTDMSGDGTRAFGITDGHYAWSMGGFIKSGSDNNYVLLGGGGHAAVSNLSVSYAASAGTVVNKPSYNFSEIEAGNATIGDGGRFVVLRISNGWRCGMYYHTYGDEAMVFGNENARTSFIFANTEPTAYTSWASLTPAMQIKRNCVYINNLISDGVVPSYNLFVNGNAKFALGDNLSPASGADFSGSYSFNIVKSTAEQYGLHICIEGDGDVVMQSCAESTLYYGILLNPLGGNVGIGTTSPSYKLDVNGTIRASGNISTDQGCNISSGGSVSAAGGISSVSGFTKANCDDTSVLLAGGGHYALSNFVTSSTLAAYLPLSGGSLTGTLQIGSAPNYGNLNVFGGALFGRGTGSVEIDYNTYAIYVGTDGTRTGNYMGGIAFSHMLNYGGQNSYVNAPQAWIGMRLYDTPGSERSSLVFATKEGTGTANTGYDVPMERMCIDPFGNVGIGTTSPTSKLTVNGNISGSTIYANNFSANNTISADGSISTLGNVTADGFVKSGSSSSYVLLGDGGHKAVSDFLTNPTAADLTFNSGCSIYMYQDSSHRSRIYSDADGLNVSFDSGATTDFNVSGDISATGNIYAGSNLVATQAWVTNQGYITSSGSCASSTFLLSYFATNQSNWDANNTTTPCAWYYGQGGGVSNKPADSSFGGLFTVHNGSLNESLSFQFYGDIKHGQADGTGHLWWRSKNDLGWQNWKRIMTYEDFDDSSYLLKAGGTMSGTISYSFETSNVRILYGTYRGSGIKYDYGGNEAFIISAGTYGSAAIKLYTGGGIVLNDSVDQYLTGTPALDLKMNCVAVNYNFTATTPSYTFYVNGTSAFNGVLSTTNGSNISCGGSVSAAGGISSVSGFTKANCDDTSVLLAGGGHLALSSFLTNPMTTHLSFNSSCDIRMYDDSTHYTSIHEDSDGLNIGFANSNSNGNLVVAGGIENTGSVTVGNTLTVNGTTTSVGTIYGSSSLYLEGDLYIRDTFPQGGGAFYWHIDGNGYGVMTVSGGTAVAFSCQVNATSFNQTSDARKKNISDYDVEPNLWDIAYAPAIRYTWKEGRDKANHVGSLAQYWKAILPEAVTESFDGYLGMQYDVIALLSAISIAKKTVEHERRISELERENAILRNRIETLEAA